MFLIRKLIFNILPYTGMNFEKTRIFIFSIFHFFIFSLFLLLIHDEIIIKHFWPFMIDFYLNICVLIISLAAAVTLSYFAYFYIFSLAIKWMPFSAEEIITQPVNWKFDLDLAIPDNRMVKHSLPPLFFLWESFFLIGSLYLLSKNFNWSLWGFFICFTICTFMLNILTTTFYFNGIFLSFINSINAIIICILITITESSVFIAMLEYTLFNVLIVITKEKFKHFLFDQESISNACWYN